MAISIVNTSTASIGCTSGTVAMPTGVTTGDLLLMCYAVEDRNWPNESGSVTGFTELLNIGDNFGGTGRVLYRVITQPETTGGTTYTLNNLNKNCCVMLMALRGADTSSPLDRSNLVGRGVNDTTTGITTTVDNSLIFQMAASIRNTPTFSGWTNSVNPLTWTEQCDFLGNRDVSWCPAADGVAMGLATAPQTTAGNIGNTSFYSTLGAQNNDLILVFNIKAASAAPVIYQNLLIRKNPAGGIFYFKTGEYVAPIVGKKLAVNLAALGENGVGTVGYYTGITWTPSGGTQQSWTWNFLPSDILGQPPTTACTMSMKYTDGTSPSSPYWVRIMSYFSATYNNGKVTGNNTGVYPDNVIQYNLANYQFPVASQNIRLSGLTTTITYKLTFCGSRTDPGFLCGSMWTITGGTTKDGSNVSLNVTDNALNTVSISAIQPSSTGIIDIAMNYTGASQGEWCSIEIDENA